MNTIVQIFDLLSFNNDSNDNPSNSSQEEKNIFQYETEDIFDDEIAKNYNGNIWRKSYFSFLETKINEKLNDTC